MTTHSHFDSIDLSEPDSAAFTTRETTRGVAADSVNPFLAELPCASRTVTRCQVCGFSEVFTDEVIDRGWLLLAECPRCDHRWTERARPAIAFDAPSPRGAVAPARVAPRRRAPRAA